MARRKKDYTIWIVLSILALAGVLVYGGNSGWFQFNLSIFNEQPNAPLAPEKQLYTYNVEIDIEPERICVGDSATGSIDSNIPNGVCTIFTNTGEGYKFFMNANLDAAGKWSQSAPVNTPGTAYFMAVCCDRESNCRISNVVTLIAEFCSEPDPNAGGGEEDAAPEGGMPCASIINYATPEICAEGYCSSGTCVFMPANLVMPARCVCGGSQT